MHHTKPVNSEVLRDAILMMAIVLEMAATEPNYDLEQLMECDPTVLEKYMHYAEAAMKAIKSSVGDHLRRGC